MLRLVLCRSRYFICEGKFNILLYINLSYKVSFPRRYFRRQESRTHCCSLANYQDSGILQLRYAVNTLASVTPRLITKCIWLQSLGSFLTRFRSVEFGTIVYISRRQDTIFISYRTLIEEKSKRHGGVHFGVVVVD